jgi:hypothetical protein
MNAILLLASISTAIGAPAQGHDALTGAGMPDIAFLKGAWTGKQNFNTGGSSPMVADITNQISDAVGGRYLEEKLATTLPGRSPTDVRHFITYDPKAKVYRAWWFNDTSVGPMEFEGALTGHKLVMQTKAGSGPNTFRATYDASASAELNYTFELQTPTGWRELFKASYSRAQGAD